MPKIKFVIISHLRSGTHLLRTLLESHPQIACQSEVFNSDNPNLPYPLSTNTQEVLDRWVYRKFPDHVNCVGFVLQAYHPFGLKAFPGIRENPHWADIWTYLINTPEMRIIHLRRNNSLRRHLSHRMARRTRQWHHWDENRVDAVSHLQPLQTDLGTQQAKPALTLDPERLLQDFNEVEQLHEQVARRFSGGRYFALSYEGLCSNPESLCEQLLQFLSVQNMPLNAAVKKLEDRPLAESIVNFEQLYSQFKDTRWETYFEKPD